VLTLAGVLLEPLAKEVLTVLVHIGCVPEKVAFVVDLVQDLEALFIRLWRAVEGALKDFQSVDEDHEFTRLIGDLPGPLCHSPAW
jgi:hypothetical protein